MAWRHQPCKCLCKREWLDTTSDQAGRSLDDMLKVVVVPSDVSITPMMMPVYATYAFEHCTSSEMLMPLLFYVLQLNEATDVSKQHVVSHRSFLM